MDGVRGRIDIRNHDIEILFSNVLETRQPHSSSKSKSWIGGIVVGEVKRMFQGLAGYFLGRIGLKVLRQSTTSVEDLALQVALKTCAQTEFRDVLVVPHHGEIIIQVNGIGASLKGEIVWVVFQEDAVLVA